MIRTVVTLAGTPQARLLKERLEGVGIQMLTYDEPDEAAQFLVKHEVGSLACAPWTTDGIALIRACREQGIAEPVVLLVTDERTPCDDLIDPQLSRIESARQAGALGAVPSSALGHPFIGLFLKGLAAMGRHPEIAQIRTPTLEQMIPASQITTVCAARKLSGDLQHIQLGEYLGMLDALPQVRRLLSLIVFMANGHPMTSNPAIGVINDLTFLALADFYATDPIPNAQLALVEPAA